MATKAEMTRAPVAPGKQSLCAAKASFYTYYCRYSRVGHKKIAAK
jgi:hypothetical protein